jgi:hypothetical protein
VRALYDQMVLITIEPDWAKLLDFGATIPKAVEDLVRAHQGVHIDAGEITEADERTPEG